MVQIGPKLDKSGTFKDQLSVNFSLVRILISKSPRSVPFDVNLAQFEAKSDIPDNEVTSADWEFRSDVSLIQWSR